MSNKILLINSSIVLLLFCYTFGCFSQNTNSHITDNYEHIFYDRLEYLSEEMEEGADLSILLEDILHYKRAYCLKTFCITKEDLLTLILQEKKI